jgi:molybdopterin/thiamine biosynthesis adenylyltransferase
MYKSYDDLKNKTDEIKNLYKPVFYNLRDSREKQAFEELLQTPSLFIYDEISDQLKELLKSRNPTRILKPDDYAALITEHLNGAELFTYGIWVYYPWAHRLVHILDEEEFIEVRTSRNQYKITVEERAVLATKRVGVVGLSVGQSVALTMAMERSFGELRLADFDLLELTNLNRIRTGLYNLGIKKVIAVAREITEIDPFLKLTLYDDGLTDENISDFFLQGGKLDVIIDECDGVDMKFRIREEAKKLQVPVLMEASDRGTIDVERFDLEPDRPLLHGLIDHLDVSKLKYLKTNEERIPYLAPMVGIDTMSVRLKASAVEVGKSITTWPQLASAVVLGGGAVADIWRRVALDQYHESGRYFVDMDELVGDKRDVQPLSYNYVPFEPIKDKDAIIAVTVAAESGAVKPGDAIIRRIVESAITAPTGGNCQPWKWVYKNGTLSLLYDRYYSYSFMDFMDRASYTGLGSAIENAVLTAHKEGFEVKLEYFPDKDNRDFIANLSFYDKNAAIDGLEVHNYDDLEPQIFLRHTNRKITERISLKNNILDELREAATSVKGAGLKFFSDDASLTEIGRVISATDRYRLLYPQTHRDLVIHEMRWSVEEANRRRTGMDVNTLDLRPSELVGLKLIKDPAVVAFLRKIGGGLVFEGASEKLMKGASAAGILTMPGYSELDFIEGGRAGQRLWLKATELNIGFQPLNVPFAFFDRLEYDRSELPEEIVDNLEMWYDRFKKLTGDAGQKGYIYLFRLFEMSEPAVNPLRRPLNDVLLIEQ